MICLLGSLPSLAQEKKQVEMPDFKHCFEVMRNSRVIYDRHNDSIFSVKNHDEWVKFFYHRVEENRRLYDTDAEIMRRIEEYFAQDSTSIPLEAYTSLFP